MTCSLPMMHEAKAYRVRKTESAWYRDLLGRADAYGDRGYKSVEVVKVCKSEVDESIRQVEKDYKFACLPVWLCYCL